MKNNPQIKMLLAAGAMTLVILGSVATFNYRVDPMCFYHCEKVEIDKLTRNHFYHIGQKLLAHKDSKIIMLGSSRGQTTPVLWIQKTTGQKTLNLSIGAAELTAKLAFLNMALENMKLKKVIWYADYFELVPETIDVKIKSTPALRAYLEEDLGRPGFFTKINDALKLIDHNTLEASYYALKNVADHELDQGSGSHLDIASCASQDFPGERSVSSLEKENGITYDTYTRQVLKYRQSEKSWDVFIKKLHKLSEKNIETLILITPYNPDFMARLKKQYPDIIANHQKWITRLKSLQIPHIKVANYFEGIPGDDKSPKFWNDGVHFTCHGAIEMLKHELASSRK